MKIFFATFFIAEIIIAVAVILKIWQLDRYVIKLNGAVLSEQSKISIFFSDFRFLLRRLNRGIFDFRTYMIGKRQEYFLKLLKTSLIYSCIFLLKGRYKKSILAYQLVKEIYEGYCEAIGE